MSEQKLPTIQDLSQETELTKKENGLMVLLNQPPPEKWLVSHPFIVGHRYLPIARVEYLMDRIFTKWWTEILDSKVVANSMVVTVRLFAVSPINGELLHNDGIGATPIQTKKGAGAMDFNQAQPSGVQMAAPSAKSYAFKDAAESFGKLFGKDVARKEQIDYNSLLKTDAEPKKPTLTETHPKWEQAKKAVADGASMEDIQHQWEITEDNYMKLCL